MKGGVVQIERLTNRISNDLIKCQDCIEESNCYEQSCGHIEKAIHRLQEYENTGLIPEEIERLTNINGSLVRAHDRQNKEIKYLRTELDQSTKLHVERESEFICKSDIMCNSKWCEAHCEFGCPQEECYCKYFELKRDIVK